MSERLRWVLVVCIAALIGGAGWAVYHRMTSQVSVRVAVGQHRGDDALLIGELAKWMASSSRRTRIEIITVADDQAAVAAVREGKAALASVRGDQPLPGGVNSALALYRAVATIVALPQSGVKDWPQLRGKTIGLLGHLDPQDPLLQKILRARGVTDARFVPVERTQVDDVLRRNAVHAIAQISPLNANPASEVRAGRAVRRIKGAATVLEIADAEALAAADNRYEDFDIPAGALRDTPPMPQEATSTLAVIRHLVVRGNAPAHGVQRILIDIMDAKRAVAPDFPLALQIGSPGVEKDAAIKIHPGALSYFNGEEIKLSDMVIEWIYIVPVVVGGVGAVLTWLYNLLWPAHARRAQQAIVELLVMRRDVARAQTLADIDAIEKKRDDIQALIDEEFSTGALKDRVLTALLVAAEAADRKIDFMRERLSRATMPENTDKKTAAS
ncbi:MAG: TAXI family TRAP transporter solute-binding subunit [Beijerinckiaceae bacterium]